jgi:hypothetical protein
MKNLILFIIRRLWPDAVPQPGPLSGITDARVDDGRSMTGLYVGQRLSFSWVFVLQAGGKGRGKRTDDHLARPYLSYADGTSRF